jgi:hypothetical protein
VIEKAAEAFLNMPIEAELSEQDALKLKTEPDYESHIRQDSMASRAEYLLQQSSQ